MAGRLLLDTSVVVEYLRHGTLLVDPLRSGTELYLPVTVVGELRYGVEVATGKKGEKREGVEAFVSDVEVLSLGVDTADHYAACKAALKRAGRPIPENDIWIAAVALEHGLPLFSKDAHFSWIPGVELVAPVEE